MILIPFLEATAEYQRLKAFRQGEITMISLEKSMANDMARFFRHQGNILLQYLPEEFDEDDFQRAWDRTQLETYLEFRDLLLKHKRRAAYTCLRALENELSIPLEEAAKPRTIGTKISFDDFDEEAFRYIEQNAGKKISQIDDSTKKDIREIIAKGFKGEIQPDGTTKYKTHQQIAKEIKDKFKDFGAPVKGPSHIRNRAHLVAVTELREAGETSKQLARDKMESRGWQMLKRWMNMGDDRVSDGCIENGNAGWIDNKEAFPSGHQFPPRFPGCRCGAGSRVGDRKERSGLPDDRWIVTRQGDKVVVKPNPKYANGYDKPIVDVPVQPSIITPAGKSVDDLYNDVKNIYSSRSIDYKRARSEADILSKKQDELSSKAFFAKKNGDTALYTKLSEESDRVGEEMLKKADEFAQIRSDGRKEIHELISHKLGGSIHISNSPANLDESREFMERLITPDVQKKLSPKYIDSPPGREFSRYWEDFIFCSTKTKSADGCHEIAHLLEKDPDIFDSVTKFYERRTQGEILTPLPTGAGEVTKKDKFLDEYTGRWYEWDPTWTKPPNVNIANSGQFATEILSKGAEFMYLHPGKFAIEDPDHFAFVLKIFRGELP